MTQLDISSLPKGHVVLGYVACLKVLDENGELYFAMRSTGLNDMESLGMTHDMLNTFQTDMADSKEYPDEH